MVIYQYPQPSGVTMKQKDLDAMLDELVKDRTPEEILGESGLVKELTKRLVERALEGELTASAYRGRAS